MTAPLDAESQPRSKRDRKLDLEHHFAQQFDSLTYTLLADHYLQEGDLDRARKVCQIGLDHHPKHAPGLFLLATMAVREGQMETAEELLLQTLNADEYHIEAAELLVAIQERLKRKKSALEQAYRRLLTANPLSRSAQDRLHRILAEKQLVEEVKAHLEESKADVLTEEAGAAVVADQDIDQLDQPTLEKAADDQEAPSTPTVAPFSQPSDDDDWSWEANIKRLAGMVATTDTTAAEIAPLTKPPTGLAETEREKPVPTPEKVTGDVIDTVATEEQEAAADEREIPSLPTDETAPVETTPATEIFETLADKERLAAESDRIDITRSEEDIRPETALLAELDQDLQGDKDLWGPEGALADMETALEERKDYAAETEDIGDEGQPFEPSVETTDTDTSSEGEVIDTLGIEIKEADEDVVLPGVVFTPEDETEVKPSEREDLAALEGTEEVVPFDPGSSGSEPVVESEMASPPLTTIEQGEGEEHIEPEDAMTDMDTGTEGEVIDTLGIETKEADEDVVLPGVVFTPEDEIAVKPSEQEDLTALEGAEEDVTFDPGKSESEPVVESEMASTPLTTTIEQREGEEHVEPEDAMTDMDTGIEGEVIETLGIETKEADEDVALPGVVFTPEDEVEVKPGEQEELTVEEHEEQDTSFEPDSRTLDATDALGMESPAFITPESVEEVQEFQQTRPEEVTIKEDRQEEGEDELLASEIDVTEETSPGESAGGEIVTTELGTAKTTTEREDADFEPGTSASEKLKDDPSTIESQSAEDWRVEELPKQSGVQQPYREIAGEQEFTAADDSDTVGTVGESPLATDIPERDEEILTDSVPLSREDTATSRASFEPGTPEEQDEGILPEDSLASSAMVGSQAEQAQDFKPGTAPLTSDEPSPSEADLDLAIPKEDVGEEESTPVEMDEHAGADTEEEPAFQPGILIPEDHEPGDDQQQLERERSTESEATRGAFTPDSVSLEEATPQEYDIAEAITQEEEPASHALESGDTDDLVPEPTEMESEILVDTGLPTESFEPGTVSEQDEDDTTEEEEIERVFTQQLEESKEPSQPELEQETDFSGTETDDTHDLDEATEGGHDFISESDIELTDLQVEHGEVGSSAEAEMFEPGTPPQEMISESPEEELESVTSEPSTIEETPFQPGAKTLEGAEQPPETDQGISIVEPAVLEADQAQPEEEAGDEEQPGPVGESPDSAAIEGRLSEEARFEPGKGEEEQIIDTEVSGTDLGEDESKLAGPPLTWSEDIPAPTETTQVTEPDDQAILAKGGATEDQQPPSGASDGEETTLGEVTLGTVRMEDKDVEKVPFEPGDQEAKDTPAALETEEMGLEEEPYPPDTASLEKEAELEQDTLERAAYDDQDMEGERFEASTAPSPEIPSESELEAEALPAEESAEVEESREEAEPEGEPWIDPKLATFTLATIYKVQGLYQQALQVLDMLEAKGADQERIAAERESIIQQMTSGSQPE